MFQLASPVLLAVVITMLGDNVIGDSTAPPLATYINIRDRSHYEMTMLIQFIEVQPDGASTSLLTDNGIVVCITGTNAWIFDLDHVCDFTKPLGTEADSFLFTFVDHP